MISIDREVEYGAALALALSGDSPRAQTLAHDLEIRFPEDTSVRFNYLPVLRGILALNQGAPSKRLTCCRWRFLMIWAPSAARFTASSALSIRSSFAAMPTRLAPGLRSGCRVSEDSRSPWNRSQRSGRRARPPAIGQGLCADRRYDQSQVRLSGLPYALEGRRSQHPDFQSSQGGIRQAAVNNEYNLCRTSRLRLRR